MKKAAFQIAVFTCALLVSAPNVQADNRSKDDPIFKSKSDPNATTGWVQVLLTAAELGAARSLLFGSARAMTMDEKVISAQSKLDHLKDTQAANETARLERLAKNTVELDQLTRRINELKAVSVQTSETRTTLAHLDDIFVEVWNERASNLRPEPVTAHLLAEDIKMAEKNLAATKVRAGRPAYKGTAKFFNGITVVAGALFALDAAGRIYVWHVLDKDPDLSPILSVVRKAHSEKSASNSAAVSSSHSKDGYLERYEQAPDNTASKSTAGGAR